MSYTIINHEVSGHVFLSIEGGHPSSLWENTSILGSSGPLTTPGVVDIKAGDLIYEDTYEEKEPSKHLLALTEGVDL